MEHLWQIQHSYLIPLLPLIGAAIAGFFGARWLKGQSHWPIWIGVFCSAALSFMILFGTLGHMPGHVAEKGAKAEHADHSAASGSGTIGVNRVLFNCSARTVRKTRPPEMTAWTSESGASAMAPTWKSHATTATPMPMANQRDRNSAADDRSG